MKNFGLWRMSTGRYANIVSDVPTGIDDPVNVEGYGGHLVCETVAEGVKDLLFEAPDLYVACHQLNNALKKYGTQISDLFGHDEEFTDALADIRSCLRMIDGEPVTTE